MQQYADDTRVIDPGFERNTPPFSFSNAQSIGWTIFQARYGVLLACSAVLVVYEVIKSALDFACAALTGGYELVGYLCILLLDGAVYAGAVAALIAVLRGRRITGDDAFVGFARYPSAIGTFIIVSLAYGLPMLVAGALGLGAGALISLATSGKVAIESAGLGAIVGILLALPFSLFVLARVTFSMLLLVDPRLRSGNDQRPLGALEAVRTSWRITSDCWGATMGLVICNLLLVILTGACLVLPMIFFGLPLALAITAGAYQQVAVRAQILVSKGDRCSGCGYSFSGLSTDRCPECGTRRTLPSDEDNSDTPRA